jgi:hypothetical protein
MTPTSIKSLSEPLKKASSSVPAIHPVWGTLLGMLVAEGGRACIEALWEGVVDEGLMHSSHERKFLAFAVTRDAVSSASADSVRALCRPSIMQSLLNHLSKKTTLLNTAALSCVNGLVKVSSNGTNAHPFSVVPLARLVPCNPKP